ncbi:MAG: tetratricopeptide repeat protein [Chthoniobacter sp.]|nr:tetratricopeptide repeat protein [Chthoniobacter sp.]
MPALTVQQAFDLALQHHQAGRLADAEALYRQILAVQPNHADALHFLGVIAHQSGRNDLAVDHIRKSIALKPGNHAAHSNLATALAQRGQLEEALGEYRLAIELKPEDTAAHFNLGNALLRQGRPDEASVAYQRALQFKPDFTEVYVNLGTALKEMGRLDEAIAAFRRAIAIDPNFAAAHNNLGNALTEAGLSAEACAVCRRAIQLHPNYAEAYSNLGNALARLAQWDEAASAFERALQLKPDNSADYYHLGNALKGQNRDEEAAHAFRRSVQLNPNFAEAYNNLGNTLTRLDRHDEAVAALKRALELKPNDATAYGNLGTSLVEQGQIDAALAAFRRAKQLMPDAPWLQSNLVYTLHFRPGLDDNALHEEQQNWNRQFAEALKPSIVPHANERSLDRRLRIGYVSPDFRNHVVGRNLWPLFQCHDHEEFEVFCYSDVLRSDESTDLFRQSAHQWRSTLGIADDVLAEMIRQDGVDILVDLTQHMSGNRLPVFARKPAPAQVSFAGYPESTGLEAIEYRISDRYLENGKSVMADGKCEQVLLIDSFWCYDPCGLEVEINELPAQPTGTVTFGSLNNFCKVNEPLLKLWARILSEVKDSRLILLSGLGSHRQRTLEFLEREGIGAQRIEFVERHPRREYLELYHRLDIALDPFPYNGHTTSLDALWMGVPVVSLAGQTAVSRAGLSQLTNLGLPELVAHAEEEYVAIATQLAGDLPRLEELRATLRPRMEASVLMDAPRFARQIEGAYRTMLRQWCAEQVS